MGLFFSPLSLSLYVGYRKTCFVVSYSCLLRSLVMLRVITKTCLLYWSQMYQTSSDTATYNVHQNFLKIHYKNFEFSQCLIITPKWSHFWKKQRIVICILRSTCPLPVSTITFLKGWLLLRHFFAIFQLCKVHFVSLDFGLCRKLLRGRNWWGKRPKSPLTQYWHQSRVWHGKGVFIKCIHQSVWWGHSDFRGLGPKF